MQAVLILGPYDPAEPMVLEGSMADIGAVSGKPLQLNHRIHSDSGVKLLFLFIQLFFC